MPEQVLLTWYFPVTGGRRFHFILSVVRSFSTDVGMGMTSFVEESQQLAVVAAAVWTAGCVLMSLSLSPWFVTSCISLLELSYQTTTYGWFRKTAIYCCTVEEEVWKGDDREPCSLCRYWEESVPEFSASVGQRNSCPHMACPRCVCLGPHFSCLSGHGL